MGRGGEGHCVFSSSFFTLKTKHPHGGKNRGGVTRQDRSWRDRGVVSLGLIAQSVCWSKDGLDDVGVVVHLEGVTNYPRVQNAVSR